MYDRFFISNLQSHFRFHDIKSWQLQKLIECSFDRCSDRWLPLVIYYLPIWFCNTVPIPVVVCSWYLSISMWRLVVKKSSLAMSLWYIDTISIFCLDSEELCLSRLMLKKEDKKCVDKCVFQTSYICVCVCVCVCVLHGSFLSLLQSLPVFLQGADCVPCLAASPPQGAVSQEVLRVRFC